MPSNHHPIEGTTRDFGISSTRRARTWQQVSDEANADEPATVTYPHANTAARSAGQSSWVVPVVGGPHYIRVGAGEPDIRIEIRGRQHDDGRVERWLAIGDVPGELPAATARPLAESLAAAHAEIERLQQDTTTFPTFSESNR